MKRLSERVAAFLAGDGQHVVRRQLSRHGLPVDVFDDVVQGVLCRVLRVELETPGFEPENLEAWTSRVVQRETRDVLRGRMRRFHREAPSFEGASAVSAAPTRASVPSSRRCGRPGAIRSALRVATCRWQQRPPLRPRPSRRRPSSGRSA